VLQIEKIFFIYSRFVGFCTQLIAMIRVLFVFFM
jgi:hypothetical protein